jgi:hypothetical protein
VAIISSYCILTHNNGTVGDKKKAEQVAYRVSKRGTIPEYKPANRHSSAIKKTTTASVAKEIKLPTFVPNPIYTPFTNAVNKLTEEMAGIAKGGEVRLKNGFSLLNKNGKPTIVFPEAYTNVCIGGVAMGDVFKGGNFLVRRTKIDDTNQEMIGEVSLCGYKRLDEPEFYCTEVTYSVLPSTKQVVSIRMTGDLSVRKTSNADRMIREIKQWMKEDYGAVDLHVDVPDRMIALKKFKIGKGMYAEVAVTWKKQRMSDGSDARIEINFTTSELEEDSLYERQSLGAAADEARVNELNRSGVNYFTVRPKVKEDDVKRKVVR